jgi:hypothetical protein
MVTSDDGDEGVLGGGGSLLEEPTAQVGKGRGGVSQEWVISIITQH